MVKLPGNNHEGMKWGSMGKSAFKGDSGEKIKSLRVRRLTGHSRQTDRRGG